MINQWRARMLDGTQAKQPTTEPEDTSGNHSLPSEPEEGASLTVPQAHGSELGLPATTPPDVGPVDVQQRDEGRDGLVGTILGRLGIASRPKTSTATNEPALKQRETFATPTTREGKTSVSDVDEIFAHFRGRRRKQRRTLAAKVLLVVLLPTLGVWLYVNKVAVPLYSANAVISVTNLTPDADAGGLGLLSAVGGGGQMQEAFMVLEFMQSPAALDILEDEVGLISYFRDDEMDPIGRVRDLEFLQIDQAQSLGRYVNSAINVQNGLISTGVRARSRDDALMFLNALLESAERHMNTLSANLFNERMAQADHAVVRAQTAVQEAQSLFVEVQIENGEVDPQATIVSIYEAINLLEVDLLTLDRRILELESTDGDRSRTLPPYLSSRNEILQLIALQRARLVEASSGRSLYEKLVLHETARAAVGVAEQTLAAALAGRNEARQAAELGVSRFQIVVPPQAPEISNYPHRTQVTAFAFFLFLSLLAIISIATPRTD